MSVLDFDPYKKKVLLLSNSSLAPQIYELLLEEKDLLSISLVNDFSIYLHADFSTRKSKSVLD